MILFDEIYNRAINLFDDPDIQRAYVFEPVKWEKIMYTYLINGLNKFTNPTKISFLLVDQTDPIGTLETFDGTESEILSNGTYQKVKLSTTPNEHSVFAFTIKGIPCPDAKYDAVDNSVTFKKPIKVGVQSSVEWYYCGQFNTDFSAGASPTTPAGVIAERVKDILARALVLAWAEDEQNFLLDIKNVLTDTDFKVYSPANSIKAKTEWVKQMQFEFDTRQTKLAWDVFSRKFHGGNYYV